MSDFATLEEAFARIGQQEGRYPERGYLFVLAALEYAQGKLPARRHLSGAELAWACRDFALDQFGLDRILPAGVTRAQLRIERLLGVLARTDLQPQVVGHPKNPSPGIPDLLAFAHRGVQPKKYLLGRLLRPRRIQTKREQVAVDVLARFLEQPRHLLL